MKFKYLLNPHWTLRVSLKFDRKFVKCKSLPKMALPQLSWFCGWSLGAVALNPKVNLCGVSRATDRYEISWNTSNIVFHSFKINALQIWIKFSLKFASICIFRRKIFSAVFTDEWLIPDEWRRWETCCIICKSYANESLWHSYSAADFQFASCGRYFKSIKLRF